MYFRECVCACVTACVHVTVRVLYFRECVCVCVFEVKLCVSINYHLQGLMNSSSFHCCACISYMHTWCTHVNQTHCSKLQRDCIARVANAMHLDTQQSTTIEMHLHVLTVYDTCPNRI